VYGSWRPVPGFDSEFTSAAISRPSDLPKITHEMLRRGFNDAEIRKVLGCNVQRVFREVLGVPAC